MKLLAGKGLREVAWSLLSIQTKSQGPAGWGGGPQPVHTVNPRAQSAPSTRRPGDLAGTGPQDTHRTPQGSDRPVPGLGLREKADSSAAKTGSQVSFLSHPQSRPRFWPQALVLREEHLLNGGCDSDARPLAARWVQGEGEHHPRGPRSRRQREGAEGRFDVSRDADPGAKDERNGSWFRAVRPRLARGQDRDRSSLAGGLPALSSSPPSLPAPGCFSSWGSRRPGCRWTGAAGLVLSAALDTEQPEQAGPLPSSTSCPAPETSVCLLRLVWSPVPSCTHSCEGLCGSPGSSRPSRLKVPSTTSQEDKDTLHLMQEPCRQTRQWTHLRALRPEEAAVRGRPEPEAPWV